MKDAHLSYPHLFDDPFPKALYQVRVVIDTTARPTAGSSLFPQKGGCSEYRYQGPARSDAFNGTWKLGVNPCSRIGICIL